MPRAEGGECSRTQFRCYDDTGCVDERLLCDGFSDCRDSSDEGNCLLKEDRYPDTPLSDGRPMAPGKFGHGTLNHYVGAVLSGCPV